MTTCFYALLFAAVLAAGATANLPVTVVTTHGSPLAGVAVEAKSASGTFTAKTDSDGKAIFFGLPPDTYTVTVSYEGYTTKSQTVSVYPDQSQTVNFRLQLPEAAPEPAPVRSELVAGYNNAHPLYRKGGYFFGRYTYVIMHGSTAANKALILALVRKNDTNDSLQIGPVEGVQNPLGYNLFAIPLKDSVTSVSIKTDSEAGHNVLVAYNQQAADNIRSRYCEVAGHTTRSLCTPNEAGPMLITVLRPLQLLKPNEAFPPALAYDLTGIPDSQMDIAVDSLSKAVVSTQDVKKDQMLSPPFFLKYVAPVLASITDGLQTLLPAMKVFKDAGFMSGATGAASSYAIRSDRAKASPY